MEENNTEENNTQNINEAPKHICFENHCWKKCLAMLCAAFLGGFLAFYFVADQVMNRYMYMPPKPNKFEKRMFDDMEKMHKRDMKAFDDAFKAQDRQMQKMHRDMEMPEFMPDSVNIKSEFDNNLYKIIIGLKPFGEDENKINYNINGRKLTVFGNSDVRNKEMQQQISFSQDFILPENADIANIKKEKDGKKLIISIPVKG